MSEQEKMQATAKLRRSRRTQKQNGAQPLPLPLPANDDKEGWEVYWKAQGQPWRTEPEIDAERRVFLAERRSIQADIEKGIYPFKEIELSRADVEWLLATHENGRGPVKWSDESQRVREGLDLRGTDLCQAKLSGLPLAYMRGGLIDEEWMIASKEQVHMAAVLLKEADLVGAQLQKAKLGDAQLQKADLRGVQLQEADLRGVQLQEADLGRTQLQKADLRGAQLQKAYLGRAQLRGADLRRADLEHATLDRVTLSDEQYGAARLADISWGNANLAVVDWGPVKELGDEQRARRTKDVDDYREAVRANRQLAVALQSQGLNENAAGFAYRAQKLQRVVLRRQRKFGQYLFFLFLDMIAGYGYRPVRSVLWYLAIIVGFAIAYYAFGHLSLFPPDAFVYSLTSFHGRGFFPGLENRHSLHDPLVMLAAIEAVVGLFIEISFIATFTQRFFGK